MSSHGLKMFTKPLLTVNCVIERCLNVSVVRDAALILDGRLSEH